MRKALFIILRLIFMAIGIGWAYALMGFAFFTFPGILDYAQAHINEYDDIWAQRFITAMPYWYLLSLISFSVYLMWRIIIKGGNSIGSIIISRGGKA